MDRINLPTSGATSVTPPPVIPPPLPNERLSGRVELPATQAVVPARLRRSVFSVKIGCLCLLFGLLLSQSGLVDRSAQRAPISASAPTSDLPLLAGVHISPDSKAELQPTALMDAVDEIESQSQFRQLVAVGRASELSTNQIIESPAQKPAALPIESEQVDSSGNGDIVATVVADAIEEPSQAMFERFAPSWANIPGNRLELTTIDTLASANLRFGAADQPSEPASCQDGLESLGTALQWVDEPTEAYRAAREQDKLVFVIHISGNFKIPGFT